MTMQNHLQKFTSQFIRGCVASLLLLSTLGNTAGHHETHDQTSPHHVIRSITHYSIPPVTLQDQNRHPLPLHTALSDPKPALVEFFFTTCTTFCDIRSARLRAVQDELAESHIVPNFFSISLDPEFDRPDRLHAYATRIKPVPDNWWLLTGNVSDIDRVASAFDARNPSKDKMLHQPLTFIRANPNEPWIRLEGLMSSHELAEQIKEAVGQTQPDKP